MSLNKQTRLLIASTLTLGVTAIVGVSIAAIKSGCYSYSVHAELDALSDTFYQLAESTALTIGRVAGQDCVLFGDFGKIKEILNKVYGKNENGLGGNLGAVYRELNKLVAKAGRYASYEAFSEEAGAIHDLFERYTTKYLPFIAEEIEAACTHPCAEEIEQLELLLTTENFTNEGNLAGVSFEHYSPTMSNSQAKNVYDKQYREQKLENYIIERESAYSKIVFLAHILGRHGGTKDTRRNIRNKNESMFYSDKIAIQLTIEALKYKFFKKEGRQNGLFESPQHLRTLKSYIIDISEIPITPGAAEEVIFAKENFQDKISTSGTGIGFGRSGGEASSIQHAYLVAFRSDLASSCQLTTLHPEF